MTHANVKSQALLAQKNDLDWERLIQIVHGTNYKSFPRLPKLHWIQSTLVPGWDWVDSNAFSSFSYEQVCNVQIRVLQEPFPFGIQSTQVHLNYMSNENFLNFVSFIKKNSSKIINFDIAIENIDNNILSKLSRVTIEKSLKLIRLF